MTNVPERDSERSKSESKAATRVAIILGASTILASIIAAVGEILSR